MPDVSIGEMEYMGYLYYFLSLHVNPHYLKFLVKYIKRVNHITSDSHFFVL